MWSHIEQCNLCNGTGKVHVHQDFSPDQNSETLEQCPLCLGQGELRIKRKEDDWNR